MVISVDDELRAICRDLLADGFSAVEWAEREADDCVQTDHYEGGYSADEEAFVFTRYAEDGEVWFQFTLREAGAIAMNTLNELPARTAE
jgi:hypothetical protein